jgi:hypothetical protein
MSPRFVVIFYSGAVNVLLVLNLLQAALGTDIARVICLGLAALTCAVMFCGGVLGHREPPERL